jgi:hypothetical protein
MEHHLTAGVVSNDVLFLDKVLGQTVNGVTYCGLRARTTGAPQNHWFGPSGDPRGAGIGTKEAILHVWTSHREIIRDYGPVLVIGSFLLPHDSFIKYRLIYDYFEGFVFKLWIFLIDLPSIYNTKFLVTIKKYVRQQ